MEPYQIDNLIELVRILLVAGVSFGGFTLLLRTWLKGRRQLASEHVRQMLDSIESLHEAVDDLRVQQAAFQNQMQDRVGEISGRVEFAERLLSEGKR